MRKCRANRQCRRANFAPTPTVKSKLGDYRSRIEHNVSLLLSLSGNTEDKKKGQGIAMRLIEEAKKMEATGEYLIAWNNQTVGMHAHREAGEYERAKECIEAMKRLSGLSQSRVLLQCTLFYNMGVEAIEFEKEPEKLIAAYRAWRESWQEQPVQQTVERYAASFRELHTLRRAMPLVERYCEEKGLVQDKTEARRIIDIANSKLQHMGKTTTIPHYTKT